MCSDDFILGYRSIGHPAARKMLVDWDAAFSAHLEADERAEPRHQAFLSTYRFGSPERSRIEAGRLAGFDGPVAATHVWWDLDASMGGIGPVLEAARRLAASLVERYGHEPLCFFSGRRGFHLGMDARVFAATPSVHVPAACRLLAETLAREAGVTTDPMIYARTGQLRAPNSRHAQTGLYKAPISYDMLLLSTPEAVFDLAREPRPAEAGPAPTPHDLAVADWKHAVATAAAPHARTPHAGGTARLNELTLEFIAHGADAGQRNSRLFSAAANVAEFADVDSLAFAILGPAARDCGLPPKEVAQTIRKGLLHGRRKGNET